MDRFFDRGYPGPRFTANSLGPSGAAAGSTSLRDSGRGTSGLVCSCVCRCVCSCVCFFVCCVIERSLKIFEHSSKINPEMVPKSRKSDLPRCLGALWRPSWSQDGPRPTAKLKNLEKYEILGSPGRSKMEPKPLKNLMKNRVDFCNDFETTFSRSWNYFGSKSLSKMRSLRVVFSTSLRECEKCDLEQPSYVFAIFFEFGRLDFRREIVYFSRVFPKSILRHTFFDFEEIFGASWLRNGSQTRRKNL